VPYAIFPTRTDNIFIGVGKTAPCKLTGEIGKPELGTDPHSLATRIASPTAMRWRELAAVFSQFDAGPLCDRLLAAGLPAGPCGRSTRR
jgi:formyl-CoA transferase